jgi:hypothetical protein
MAGWTFLIVPAVAALAGACINHLLAARTERVRSHRETQRRNYEDRRAATARFIVALNQAINKTRRAARERHSNDGGVLINKAISGWHEAYERRLELVLLLPDEARKLVENHYDQCLQWANGTKYQPVSDDLPSKGAPLIERLIDDLDPWIGPVRDTK